jgi:uncharacterized protein YegL
VWPAPAETWDEKHKQKEIRMTEELKVEFATNANTRCACMLLLDTSGSMAGGRIAELNRGVRTLVEELRKDTATLRSADIAIMTFDSEVKLVQDFSTADKFEAPTLTAQGQTFLGTAIREALDRLLARKQAYKDNGITYFRPWLFILTDGESQGEPPGAAEDAAERLARGQAENRVKVFPIGVAGANLEALYRLTRPAVPLRLDETKFKECFVWLKNSLGSRSKAQNPVEQADLPDPTWRKG